MLKGFCADHESNTNYEIIPCVVGGKGLDGAEERQRDGGQSRGRMVVRNRARGRRPYVPRGPRLLLRELAAGMGRTRSRRPCLN
jgi:hypothetical protein